MNALEREIRSIIESEGPIPLSRYMTLCLAHPRHGYYMTRDPFGPHGDFVTAPEVSQMFGELIGIWAAEVWRMMGGPAGTHLVELGPGRGTLLVDLLRALKVSPEFRAAIDLHLVELSPVLAQQQRNTLAAVAAAAQWHRSVATLPQGPLIVLANEFVDALPVDQFVRAKDGWHERKVGIENDRLIFAFDPLPLRGVEEAIWSQAREGEILERRFLGPIQEIARRIAAHGGAALIVDYGHMRSGLGETLQAVRAHRVADPLACPGEADLTAHVDFEQLAELASHHGLRAFGPVSQGDFLRALGIELRAEHLKRKSNPQTSALVDDALKRLTAASPGMGDLFKVLVLAHADIPALPGFDR
jgi:SAM-dependent MidA family methyltransferase